MWPGVLTVSTKEFKPKATAIVYAHKTLVNQYISSLSEDELEGKRQSSPAAATDA